jgi:nitroreductase
LSGILEVFLYRPTQQALCTAKFAKYDVAIANIRFFAQHWRFAVLPTPLAKLFCQINKKNLAAG